MANSKITPKINKKLTIRNIIERCNSGIGYGINMDKFEQKKNDVQFLIDAAKFVRADVIYKM